MARSDEGMSSTTKAILAILGVGGVLLLVCCGGLAWWGNRVVQDFKQTLEESIAEMEEMDKVYVEDPAQIAELADSIIEIRTPPRYEPYLGEDHTSANLLRRQITYSSSDDLGGIVIREMLRDDITTRDEATRILLDELEQEGWFHEFEPASSSQRTFTINGEDCAFEFRAEKDPDTGDETRYALGAVPSGSGLAYVVVYDSAAHWDESAIIAMIESIRVGQPRPEDGSATESSPDAVAPTAAPADAPAETPESAGGPAETSGTSASDAATPQ